MFNFLKKLFDFSLPSDDELFQNYRLKVQRDYKDNSTVKFGNFSKKGFFIISELLLVNANHLIFIQMQNQDVLFDQANLFILQQKLNQGINVIIRSFNQDKDIVKLAKVFPNLKYQIINHSNSNFENNMIIVDNTKYWLEDETYKCRQNLNQFIKAEVCFNDFSKVKQLKKLVKI